MTTVLHPSPPEVHLGELADGIATRGIAAFEPELRVVAAAAAEAGASPVLVALVADPAAPRIARTRAFGRLAALLPPTIRRRRQLAPPLRVA